MDQCLLVLIASPSIENAVVDWLLDRNDIPGFTSAPISGHGPAHIVCHGVSCDRQHISV